MEEVRAILNAPEPSTRLGIRDHAMLHLCFAGGLRVSELVTLPLAQVCLQGTPSIRVHGKGRREHCLPLWKETASDLRAWLAVRSQGPMPGTLRQRRGHRDDPGWLRIRARQAHPCRRSTLAGRSVTPHQLRRSCAVVMLQATRDIRKAALWLGHANMRTTGAYLRARRYSSSRKTISVSQCRLFSTDQWSWTAALIWLAGRITEFM